MNPTLLATIEHYKERRQELLEEVPRASSGVSWCRAHTRICDQVVEAIFSHLVSEFRDDSKETIDQRIAVIATGGYGRQEMAPYSDIDITVVPKDDNDVRTDEFIRRLFQLLHEAFSTMLGLEVGYAFRLMSDAPGVDSVTRTGLLDSRHLVGSADLTRELQQALRATLTPGEFILAKIEERHLQFQKHHDTPLVTEPNLKEGAGGLRCYQVANWIREALGERPKDGTEPYDRMLQTRNLLHLVSGRRNDHLTRSRRSEIREKFGVSLDRVAEDALLLNAEFLEAVARLRDVPIVLSQSVLSIRGEARIQAVYDGGEAATGIAIGTRLGLEVSAMPVGAPASVRGEAAVYALSQGETVVRNIDKCGLLEHLLPELTACRFEMPGDAVHEFTVFEHTLRVVRMLDEVPTTGFLSEVHSAIHDPSILRLAALLHDVGKLDHSRPHSEAGEEMVRHIAERWGLPTETSEFVAWLVREHLTMARFIRIRDVMNPQTVEDFVEIVNSIDKLNSLTLLTWADANAVNERAWTPAQQTFLSTLYDRAAAVLAGQLKFSRDPALHRQRLLRQLRSEPVDAKLVEAFVESLPVHYLANTPTEAVPLHLRFAQLAIEGRITVEFNHRPELNSTEITVCAKDHTGLLSQILGTFYAFDLSVPGIRAATTKDTKVALDTFLVSFSDRPIPAATGQQVSNALQKVLSGEILLDNLLRQRGKDPARKASIISYTFAEGKEGQPSVLELRCPRGRGLPFRLSRWVTKQGWDIITARLGQYAGNAAAAFYLFGANRESVHRAIQSLRDD